MDKIRAGLSNMPAPLSGFVGAGIVAIIGLCIYTFSFRIDPQYGVYLFCASPFGLGFASSLLVNAPDGLKYRHCAGSAMWSLLFVTIGLLCFAAEGIICLAMAAPIAIPMALVGALVGFGIRRFLQRRRDQQASVCVVLAFIPLMFTREALTPPQFSEHVESTSLIINAPPEKVWPYVRSLPHLPLPTELLFRAGVAYQLETSEVEPKVGGHRVCRLSTGDIPETVEVFEPNERLVFKCLATPPTMKETSPYGEIKTKHLTGYFECRRGEFRLERLPGGRTRLVGTSWYSSLLAPDPYWRLWTDTIVEEIHLRAMNAIKLRAEKDSSRR